MHATPESVMAPNREGNLEATQSERRFRALVVCQNCRQGALFIIEWRQKAAPQQGNGIHGFLNRFFTADIFNGSASPPYSRAYAKPLPDYGINLEELFKVVERYPNSVFQRPDADYLPSDVNQAFDELEEVLSVPRYAAVACRRILEIACAGQLDVPKERLADRINQLLGRGLITKEVADWAKMLKDLLNAPTHGGDAPTPEQAVELVSFTRLFVELLYVYPKKVEQMKHASSAKQ